MFEVGLQNNASCRGHEAFFHKAMNDNDLDWFSHFVLFLFAAWQGWCIYVQAWWDRKVARKAPCAPDTQFCDIFKAPLGGHKAKEKGTKEQRSDASKTTLRKRLLFLTLMGPKSWFFDVKCIGPLFKHVLPTEGRKHSFKKASKSWKKTMLRSEYTFAMLNFCWNAISEN